jgi:hypothetical protein
VLLLITNLVGVLPGGGLVYSFTYYLVGIAQPLFQELPSHVVIRDCSQEETVTDWDKVCSEATQINWLIFGIGVILGLFAFEILDRIVSIPEKIIAVILLFSSFTSLFLLLYIFLIRKFTYIFFSLTMGAFLSLFLHLAFLARKKIWRRF